MFSGVQSDGRLGHRGVPAMHEQWTGPEQEAGACSAWRAASSIRLQVQIACMICETAVTMLLAVIYSSCARQMDAASTVLCARGTHVKMQCCLSQPATAVQAPPCGSSLQPEMGVQLGKVGLLL
jgi:hypothetical protein